MVKLTKGNSRIERRERLIAHEQEPYNYMGLAGDAVLVAVSAGPAVWLASMVSVIAPIVVTAIAAVTVLAVMPRHRGRRWPVYEIYEVRVALTPAELKAKRSAAARKGQATRKAKAKAQRDYDNSRKRSAESYRAGAAKAASTRAAKNKARLAVALRMQAAGDA